MLRKPSTRTAMTCGVSILALACVFGSAWVAEACAFFHSVGAYYGETKFSASLQVPHDNPIDIDVTHPWKLEGWWRIDVKADEDSGWNDWLTISGFFQHLCGPHGEDENPNKLDFEFFVNADNYPSGVNVIPKIEKTVVHPPTNHPDELLAILSVTTSHAGAGSDQIDSYVFRSWATHKHFKNCQHFSGCVERDQMQPDGQSSAFGSAAICIDGVTGEAEIYALIEGISIFDLQWASLRFGAPGKDGPEILNLYPSLQWQDLDGQALGLEATGLCVPPSWVPSVFSGETYLEIGTAQFPAGEVRGQLMKDATIVKPNSVEIVRGKWISGGLMETRTGDDRNLVLQATRSAFGWGPSRACVEVQARAQTDDPLLIDLDVQTSVPGIEGQATQTIKLYDFWTGSWKTVSQQPSTSSDHVTRFRTHENAGHFIEDGTGRMFARVIWESSSWLPLTPPRIHLDQIQWQLHH